MEKVSAWIKINEREWVFSENFETKGHIIKYKTKYMWTVNIYFVGDFPKGFSTSLEASKMLVEALLVVCSRPDIIYVLGGAVKVFGDGKVMKLKRKDSK